MRVRVSHIIRCPAQVTPKAMPGCEQPVGVYNAAKKVVPKLLVYCFRFASLSVVHASRSRGWHLV